VVGEHRGALGAAAVCSLTTERSARAARAKPHRMTRCVELWWAAALIATLMGCETPIAMPDAAASDASLPDASAELDGAEPLDAASAPDVAEPRDAALLDAPGATASWIADGHDVLFVGNSYVYTNDVPGRYRTAAEVIGPTPVRLEAVAPGGYRLSQHAVDARTDGTALARWLRTGTDAERDFDAIVLQEQSQIGGFPESESIRMESLAGASELAALARAGDMGVVLYLTWGRERGDEMNPVLFATFEDMQDRLDAGYRAMAARLRSEGARVRIAPVGAAFRVIHDDVRDAGMDPLAEGSAFDALYEGDGSHPSAQGAYLAATVIFATLTGVDPASLPDGTGLDAPTSAALREAAHDVMLDPAWADELR